MGLKQNIHNALHKIGSSNGTAQPTSQDPANGMLHELYVAGEMRTYANKRYDVAKGDVENLEAVVKAVDRARKFAIKNEAKTSEMAIDTQDYTLSIDCNAPSSRLDAKKLCTLLSAAGVSKDVIDKAVEGATVQSAPATSYKVITK
jgi:hypothetical protein